MKINLVFEAFNKGALTALDLGVWCYLSWHSDRAGLYHQSRKATAANLGITPRQLRASVERLTRAGVVSLQSKPGARKTTWKVETKARKENVVQIKQVRERKQETGEKPAALKHLPF